MEKWIEIDLKAIRDNVKAIKKQKNPSTRFMAVVKMDAYGHGAKVIAKEVLEAGADMLGVLNAHEAIELRKSGIKSEIMLLSPSLPESIDEIIKYNLIPTVDSMIFARKSDLALKKRKKKMSYCLDLDFGIGRWGISPKECLNFAKEAIKLKHCKIDSLSTHIDYSPPKNMVEAEEKLSTFKSIGESLKKIIPELKLHAANSSVFCDFPRWQFDIIRIGNLIYGLYPSKIYSDTPPLPGIKRPWKFYSRIISTRKVKKGESLGYASEYVAIKNMKISCLPTGYGDGLTMEPKEKNIMLSSGSLYWGILKGKKAFIIGKPGICHTLIDITDIPAKIGDKVELPIRRTIASLRLPRIYRGC